MKLNRPFVLLALLATLAGANAVHAATHTWTGAVNGFWATPGNWQNNDAPTNIAESGMVLRFPAGPVRLVTTNNIGHLSLGSLILAGNNYVLRGVSINSITFTPFGGVNILVSGANNIIGCPVQIGGPCTVSVSPSATLTIANTISGPGSLTKLGDGTLALAGNGPNSFFGGFNVSSGLVRLRQTSGVALPGPIRIGAANPNPTVGAGITLQANNQIAPYTTVGVEWDGVLYLNGFTNSLGTVSLAGGAVNTVSNTTPGLLIVNSEILAARVPQANPSMGGTIALNGARPINVSTGMLTITARLIDGQTPGGFVKLGEGDLVLTGNNTFSGVATMVAGDVKAETSTALGSAAGGTVIMNDGSALHLTYGLTINEPLSVSNYNAHVVTAGTNTWLGPITFLRTNASLYFARSLETSRTTMMRLGGVVGGPGRLGFGNLDYAEMFGTQPNTYLLPTHLGSPTELRLNKTNATAIPGDVYFGENGGKLPRLVVQRDEQIANTAWLNFFRREGEFGPVGELVINGVIETVGDLTGEGRVHCTNATLRLTGSGYFEGPLLGNALSTISKSGPGDYSVHGDQTYAGKVTIEGGSFAVFGTYPAASFHVHTEGILSGTARLSTVTLNGGTVAPGSSPDYSAGTMIITNLASANGKYRCSLGFLLGQAATTDNLKVKQLTGGLTLQLIPHFAGDVSKEFTILTPMASPFPAGAFTGLAEGATVNTTSGQSFQISYHGGLSGQEVTLTQLTLPTPPQISSLQNDAEGNRVITGTGVPGMYYTLVATTNLASPVWETLFTIIAPAPSGAISITDYDSSNHPLRFYRIRSNSGIAE
jgi:fibronectin-binding autotransporter adhesin